MPFLAFFIVLAFYSPTFAGTPAGGGRIVPSTCTYELLVWNVDSKSSSAPGKVSHPYADLSSDERDSVSGCTVCSEDQVKVAVPPLQPFFVCYKLAPRVSAAIKTIADANTSIRTIDAYRVVKSRGPVDRSGNRTAFSNHSFGTAIDINPEQNGLYDNCAEFGPRCRLLRGGEWRPGMPGTIEKDGGIVATLRAAGFRWGGEIAGRQKDFMHFSLTGY